MIKIINHGVFESTEHFDTDVTPQREVKEFEIELYSGCGGFSVINGTKYSHAGAHIICALPGDTRFSIGRFNCRFIHFESDDPLLCELMRKLPKCSETASVDEFLPYFNALCERFSDPIAQNAMNSGTVLCLASRISAIGVSNGKKNHRYGKNILEAKEYMDRNFGEKITLEILAEKTYLSRNFFRKVFTEIMEISPQKYLTGIRISHAVHMIREGMPYKDVAQSCGFDSQSYMNYVFKKETGRTPSMYR